MKRILGLILLVGMILGIARQTSAADWWNTNWQYRMKLTFDNSASGEDLDDFPVLVHLTSTHSDFWAHINSSITTTDTKDLRFIDADDSTELYFEAERIDYSAKDALIWVKVPQIDAGSLTDYIYVYYGNSGASESSYHNASSVWDSNYKMVQHLQEIGPHPQVIDSTQYGNDSVSNSADPTTSGQIDGAETFNGSSDYIDCGNKSNLNPISAITIEAWVKVPESNLGGIVCTEDYAYDSKKGYNLYFHSNGFLYFRLGDGTTSYHVRFPPALTEWVHIVGTWDGTTQILYVNGINKRQIDWSGTIEYTTDVHTWVGRVGSYYFNGTIDEVRIYSRALSAEEVYERYCNGY